MGPCRRYVLYPLKRAVCMSIYIPIYVQGERVAFVHGCGSGDFAGIAGRTTCTGGKVTVVRSIVIWWDNWASDCCASLIIAGICVWVEGSGHIQKNTQVSSISIFVLGGGTVT